MAPPGLGIWNEVVDFDPLLEHASQISAEDCRRAYRPQPEILRHREHVLGRQAVLGDPGLKDRPVALAIIGVKVGLVEQPEYVEVHGYC